MSTTWAWRIPSLLQAAPSIWCIIILFFVPESPRWLISKGRNEEALEILAIANANGETASPLVQVQFKEIQDTLRWEKERELTIVQSLAQPANRRRLLITTTFSIMVMLPGTNIVQFYFGDMLSVRLCPLPFPTFLPFHISYFNFYIFLPLLRTTSPLTHPTERGHIRPNNAAPNQRNPHSLDPNRRSPRLLLRG